jgi:hypothetical protein
LLNVEGSSANGSERNGTWRTPLQFNRRLQ